MAELNVRLSYPLETFLNTGAAFQFIFKYLKFDIKAIRSGLSYKGGDWFEEHLFDDYLAMLTAANDASFNLHDGAGLNDDADNSEVTNAVYYNRDEHKKVVFFNFSLTEADKIDLVAICTNKNAKLATGCVFDIRKTRWQNEVAISNYIALGKPYKHLKTETTSALSRIYGPMIDISENPGHEMFVYSMYLMAAPEMWFGPVALQYFDKQRIKSFPHAQDIREIDEDTVYVKLFDWTTSDYEGPEILSLQRKFRDWIKMDEVEKALIAKLKSPSEDVVISKIDLRNPEQPKESTFFMKFFKGKKK